jgi:hypothetical protein
LGKSVDACGGALVVRDESRLALVVGDPSRGCAWRALLVGFVR